MTECNTQYIFEGNISEIAMLYEAIVQLKENNEVSALIDALEYCDGSGIDCGGSIASYDMLTPTSIQVEVVTNHKENIAPFATIMRCFPSLQCYFSAQNTEVGYYVTNDYARAYFPERFIINYTGEEPIQCNRIEQLYSEASFILGEMIGSREKLVEAISKHNKSNNLDEQMRVSEVQMADDLVNRIVKIVVGRMESFAGYNPATRTSSSLYRDMRFVAQTKGEVDFIWVVLPTETKLYKLTAASDWGLFLANLEQWQSEELEFSTYQHSQTLVFRPRSAELIKNDILQLIQS
ncbi:MAG: hypothetical protein SNH27_13010 [Rikenellaceae bacterium]